MPRRAPNGPSTFPGMKYYVPSLGKSSHCTVLPMTDEEKEEVKKREANKPRFGFAAVLDEEQS
jgi:hypothetical protein